MGGRSGATPAATPPREPSGEAGPALKPDTRSEAWGRAAAVRPPPRRTLNAGGGERAALSGGAGAAAAPGCPSAGGRGRRAEPQRRAVPPAGAGRCERPPWTSTRRTPPERWISAGEGVGPGRARSQRGSR